MSICVETVLNDQGLVFYVQLLTKSDHVHNNADKHSLIFDLPFTLKIHLSFWYEICIFAIDGEV